MQQTRGSGRLPRGRALRVSSRGYLSQPLWLNRLAWNRATFRGRLPAHLLRHSQRGVRAETAEMAAIAVLQIFPASASVQKALRSPIANAAGPSDTATPSEHPGPAAWSKLPCESRWRRLSRSAAFCRPATRNEESPSWRVSRGAQSTTLCRAALRARLTAVGQTSKDNQSLPCRCPKSHHIGAGDASGLCISAPARSVPR